jgi:endonuclease/exonuclease/phosphatase family metal-dependent hydrolase
MKSNGGGANAILARRDRIVAHHVATLTGAPERRVAHGASLGCGVWVVNLHATAHDTEAAERDGTTASAAALQWAHGEPLVLGGDFNLRTPGWPGFASAGGHDVDHLFTAGAVEAHQGAEVVDLRLMVGEAGDTPDV